MGRKTFISNICGKQSKSDIAKVGNSLSLNMFPETVDASQDYVNVIQRSINGMTTLVSVNGTPRGMFTVSRGYNNKPTTYAVFDNTLYIIIANTSYQIGKLANSSNQCHFCETGGYGSAHPHLIVVDGVNIYAVNTGLSVPDQQNNFRTIKLPVRTWNKNQTIEPTHCAYLYGYLIVNDAGSDAFYTSYQYPFETVDKKGNFDYDLFRVNTQDYKDIGFITYSEWQPDNTLAICSNGSRLFTFGDKSYQVFQYNNDVNNPFTSPDTAAQLIGIKAINSLAQLGTYTLWLGSADLGNNGIYLNTGSVDSTRVSTPDIEREFASFSTVKDATAQIWQENQHIFYAITFPSANRTFVYDLKEQAWHERCSLGPTNEKNHWRYNFATLNGEGKLLFATFNAIVYQNDKRWKEHDDRPLLRLRRGGVIYNNYSNFYIDAITVELNNGQIADNEGYMGMRFTADGSNWSDQEIVRIGGPGDYDYDCTFYSFGMAKCFTIELYCTDDFPFTLMGVQMNTAECKW